MTSSTRLESKSTSKETRSFPSIINGYSWKETDFKLRSKDFWYCLIRNKMIMTPMRELSEDSLRLNLVLTMEKKQNMMPHSRNGKLRIITW